ncbi:MAG: DUF4175 family protein [Bacteroidota bacterium]
MKSNYDTLIGKLDEFIRKYYKNQLIRGGIYTVAAVLAFYLAVVLLEYYARFDTGMRTFLFYAFVLTNAFIIGRLVIIPVLKLNRLGKIISHEQASEIIGRHFSQVQDKLLNVLQLKKASEMQSGSALLTASIDQKIKELRSIPFSSAIDLSQNKRYLKYALPPFCVFIIILFAAPSLITEPTKRIVEHGTFFEEEAPFQFVIRNSELKGVQHEDFELGIKLTGNEIPEKIFIEIEGNEFPLTRENTVNFNYIFKNIQKNIKFRLSGDGFKSKEYELTALPKPILLDFDIALSYPKYLGKKDEVIRNTGDLVVPAGTKISWKFNTQNTKVLRISFNDTSFALPQTAENTYAWSARLLKDQMYSVTTANDFLRSKDSVLYSISVIPDLYPGIQVQETKDSVFTKRIYFNGQVKDDYGFSRLSFNYQLVRDNDSIKGDTGKPVSETLPVTKALNQDQFYYYWDLNGIEVNPGDRIEYYFEISDNDGVNGAKSTRSQRMVFKVPTLRELSDKTDQKNDELQKDLEQSIKDAKQIQKEIDELTKKLLEKKNVSWEEKKKLEDLLSKQKELQKKIEDMKKENQVNNQQQQEYKQQNESLLEKQKQLEELFESIMTPEMKQKYEELQKLMEQMDKNKMQEMLEKMKMDNKDLEKALDRQLEMFKQLQFEQKLDDIQKNLEELQKKQDELSKESEEKGADSKELKEKQDSLNKEFENIRKDLDELQKMNEELEQPNDLKNTDQQEQSIEQDMKKSSEQLQQNSKKDASKSQKSSSQKMQQLQQQLSQMQSSMQQESQEEDMNALRQILDNLVQLSMDQEALMAKFGKTKPDNPQYGKLIQEQKKLKDDAKLIEDSLLALSKRVFAIQQIVNKEITAINNNMDKSIENYVAAQSEPYFGMKQQYLSQGASRQQYSMTSINNLALLLSEALEQMQQQQQQQMQGSGSCTKPGGKGQKPSMSTMKQMQDALNKQIEELKKQMEQGKKDGNKDGNKGQNGKKDGKDGQGGTGGMSEMLVKLAAQQEALRQMLQEMMSNGDTPGDAKDLMKKMEETENDLVNKQITQETIKRQQEILTKLLDYEKAEKEREMEEKRESKEGKNENLSNQNQFLEYNRQKQKEAELLKTVPPALLPFYKMKVTEYFNNFE